MTFRPGLKLVSTLSAVAFITACGSGMLDANRQTVVTLSGGGGSGAAATYSGAAADSLFHGKIEVNVTGGTAATGVLTFVGGATVQLTGGVDSAAASMNLTGGGYTFTGTTHTGTVQGTYTSADGNGFFAAASDTLTHMTHTTYCGVYTSTNGNGWFAVVGLSDGQSAGFSVQTLGSASSATMLGTINFSLLTFAASTSQAVAVTGTLTSDLQTITGSYAPNVGTTTGTGTFSATASGC